MKQTSLLVAEVVRLRSVRTLTSSATRSAFTLVELMVAMALTMFIMVILSQAFVTSLEVFSGLKAIGDMQSNLRTAMTLLQEDLAKDHFEGMRRLSDPDLPSMPPRQGFFHIYQGSAPVPTVPPPVPPYVEEGIEAGSTILGMKSYRATNHVLYFTVKNRGNQVQDVFSVPVPPGSPLLPPNQTNFFNQPPDALYQQPGTFFHSQWAEVAYFLVQTGSTEEPSNPTSTVGTPLFALYRTQYLLVPDPSNIALKATVNYGAYKDCNVSFVPDFNGAIDKLFFNSPDDVAQSARRALSFSWAAPPVNRLIITKTNVAGPAGFTFSFNNPVTATAGIPPYGSSVVLSSVVSFQVQVFKQGGAEFGDLGALSFDTAASPPAAYYIQALKISIRLWDSTTKQSRQVTLVQDM